MTACPECSAVVEDNANFCQACGADVRAVTRAMQSPPDEAETTVMAAQRPDADVTAAMVHVPGDEDPTDPGAAPPVTADPTQVMTSAGTISCPNCGAPNSARRSLCGRCGADLKTGTVAPRPAPRPIAPASPAEPRASERDRATRGRTIALIVGAGILIGGLIGAAVGLGLGPLGDDDEELPPATFVPGMYGDESASLPLFEVATSTIRPAEGGVTFARERMFDGDLTTAWKNSGETNANGIGEVIRVELTSPAWVTEIVLANGDQSDGVAFTNYARIHRVTARMDGNVVVRLTFIDREGQQAARLPEPILTTAIRLEIDETFAGATFADLAVSELSFLGHLAVANDVTIAAERAQLAPTPG
ncbi:MAG: zinc ribbon domain-containing protein [Nitriliruptorales bacterium]|nr:zinc ribbon domain-containing protein [Nitriliruptorales bacterium]